MLLLQRGDLLDLDAGSELDLVAGDGRAPGAAGDRGVDLELLQHLRDRLDHPVVGCTAALRRVARRQQIQRRQRVGTIDDAVRAPAVRLGRLLALAPRGSAREPSAPRRRAGSCPSACRGSGPRPARLRRRCRPRVVVVAVGEVVGLARRRTRPTRRRRRTLRRRAASGCRTSRARCRAPRGWWCRLAAAGRTAHR